MSVLTATSVLDSQIIADLSFLAFDRNPPALKETLLLSKTEQTFSGLLADALKIHPTVRIGDFSDPDSGIVLLEFKGKDYSRKTAEGVKKSRNYHDLSVVNQFGEIEVIIENKYWYHFDGTKGKKNPKPEKGIKKQLSDDIFKIRQTLAGQSILRKGFVLLNIVTPGNPELIPTSYQDDHRKVWNRTNHDIDQYRKEGLEGFQSVMSSFSKDLKDIALRSSPLSTSEGFIDFICAEVQLNL
jgi:hypothetical protein